MHVLGLTFPQTVLQNIVFIVKICFSRFPAALATLALQQQNSYAYSLYTKANTVKTNRTKHELERSVVVARFKEAGQTFAAATRQYQAHPAIANTH